MISNQRLTRATSKSLGTVSDSNSSIRSLSTETSLDTDEEGTNVVPWPSNRHLVDRARAAHVRIDFDALGADLETDDAGAWERVDVVDAFVVSKRVVKGPDTRLPGLDLVCTGPIDATLAEVARLLRSHSELELASTLHGLYAKQFLFATLDREVPCTAPRDDDDDVAVDALATQLHVKTTSFTRPNVLARNEQWCFAEWFQPHAARDGFTISQRALPRQEPTPGRVRTPTARVNQLHGLNASYRVDKIPHQTKGVRILYNVWFEQVDDTTHATSEDCRGEGSLFRSDKCPFSSPPLVSSPSRAANDDGVMKPKHQLRRLLSLSHGLTNLPELIRRRRYGFQVPANLGTIHVANPRCPCCTHSLTPLKRSLSRAAVALATKSVRALKSDTRRCYLCGYRVCINCWRAECMESRQGRVASIVVCTRCHASVHACDYAHVAAAHERRPAQVIPEDPNESTAFLLTAFLEASFTTAATSQKDRRALVDIVRILLEQSGAKENAMQRDTLSPDSVPLDELSTFLRDRTQFPALETCVFASAEAREYLIHGSDTRTERMVPSSLNPHADACRLKVARESGLLQLAHDLAPVDTCASRPRTSCDMQDLHFLCQLAVRTTQFAHAFVAIMGTQHNHVVAATHADFLHAALPREETFCQHTILSTDPFLITYPEADVRFHHMPAIEAFSIRTYVGFPMMMQTRDEEKTIAMGTFCCFDARARGQLTRTQYTTMKRLAETASRLIQLKGQQLLHPAAG
ncbi:hypothetical protein PsorP6_010355 [Peronosclerospora sorghi]|uniref:Uncharacterized protein n=1 Tax=Peronosclerospora sorghi TaxID=230839 RepID=A0ACC0VXX1_9STRA|nr:hypothetical protein PsorP6_010355 [Peronosclerospora sorghi]